MKKFKIITLTLFFFALFATSAIAQVQADAEMNVGATVDNALTLEAIQNLDFGDIESSTDDDTINLDNDETDTGSAGDNAQYGIFELDAGDQNDIQLSVSNSITLTDLNDSNLTLEFVPLIFRIDSDPNVTLINTGDTEHTIESADLDGNVLELYVGGDLNGSYDPGVYTGSLTLTVQYL